MTETKKKPGEKLANISHRPLAKLLYDNMASLESALSGKSLVLAEFAIALDNAVAMDNALRECVEKNPQSVRNAILHAAMLGLRPGKVHKQFAMTCFQVQGKPVCVGIPEWRGLVQIANMAGQLDTDIRVGIAYKHEVKPPKGQDRTFGYDPATGLITHDEDLLEEDLELKTPENMVCAYATCRVKGRHNWATVVLKKSDVYERRKSSSAFNYAEKNNKRNSLWHTNEKAMWRKSAIRALLDSGKIPMSRDYMAQIEQAERRAEEVAAAQAGSEDIKPAEATVVDDPGSPSNSQQSESPSESSEESSPEQSETPSENSKKNKRTKTELLQEIGQYNLKDNQVCDIATNVLERAVVDHEKLKATDLEKVLSGVETYVKRQQA